MVKTADAIRLEFLLQRQPHPLILPTTNTCKIPINYIENCGLPIDVMMTLPFVSLR